jgi:hypothetical protein
MYLMRLKSWVLRFIDQGPVPARTLSLHIYVSRQQVPYENALASTIRSTISYVAHAKKDRTCRSYLTCVPCDIITQNNAIAVGTKIPD